MRRWPSAPIDRFRACKLDSSRSYANSPLLEGRIRSVVDFGPALMRDNANGSCRANIGQLGLKKPITVALSQNGDHRTRYSLACGQGRLEAFLSLGQTEIPALLIEASKDDLLLMSLVENLARRQHTTVDRAKEVGDLKNRGCSSSEIAERTGLDATYVNGIVRLWGKGEERLVQAVEKQQIPISVAIKIASSDDKSVQRAMADAYEKKELRGRAL